MSTVRYLAYGSNLYVERLSERVGRIRVIASTPLPDWSLAFSKRGADGSGKCTLDRLSGALAFGVVYEIAATAEKRLDEIEGLGRGYHKAGLDLPGLGRCFVYLADPAFQNPVLSPFDWYKTLVVGGARQHGLPDAYIESLKAVPAQPDPDAARAALNLAVMTGSA